MNPRPVSVALAAIASVVALVALVAAPAGITPAAGALDAREASAAGAVPDPAPPLARISIDSVTPEVLDAAAAGTGTVAGVPTITVSGTIRNTGTAALTNVDVRLQRGPRVPDASAVRDPLLWGEPSFQVHGAFRRLTPVLQPGVSLSFRVTLPVTAVPGRGEPDLQITEPGVYPLLVNVNGTPQGAGPARLDDARTLLPVLSTPWAPAPRESSGRDPGGDEAGAGRPTAAPVTVLLPLASTGTRRSHRPGVDGDEPAVVLADPTLLAEITPGGRLSGLVEAATTVFTSPGGARLRDASCLAVDPALLITLDLVAAGRPVLVDTGNVAPGSAESARAFLRRMRELASGMCVLGLPAAQADLDAVARVTDSQLTAAALGRGEILTRVLGARPLPDVLVPPGGTLAPETPARLGIDRGTVVLASSATRTDTGVPGPLGTQRFAAGSGPLAAVTFAPALGAALAATGSAPENPAYIPAEQRYWLEADSPSARLQDARAALVAPVVDRLAGRGDTRAGIPADTELPDPGVFVVPPAVWTVDQPGATSLLALLSRLIDSGRMTPLPLPARLDARPAATEARPAQNPTGTSDPGMIDEDVVMAARRSLGGLAVLQSLVDVADPQAATAVPDHLDPIVDDVLGTLSVTGRRAGGDGTTTDDETGRAARESASHRAASLADSVATARGNVDLLPPGSVFTMASPTSPLLMVVRNGLPFPVRVHLDVGSPPGLRVLPVGEVRIPASGSRTVQLPTESTDDDSTRRSVTLALLSPDGQPVSEPVTISVQSGGYPLALVFTVAAAALALVLVVRRYLRYRRGTPDPSDEGHRP